MHKHWNGTQTHTRRRSRLRCSRRAYISDYCFTAKHRFHFILWLQTRAVQMKHTQLWNRSGVDMRMSNEHAWKTKKNAKNEDREREGGKCVFSFWLDRPLVHIRHGTARQRPTIFLIYLFYRCSMMSFTHPHIAPQSCSNIYASTMLLHMRMRHLLVCVCVCTIKVSISR